MKIFLSITALLCSMTAIADTQIVYGGGDTVVVQDTVNFPNYGDVNANNVCVSADHQILMASMPGKTEKVCVASTIDRSDSTHPVTVCTQWQTQTHPPVKMTRPVTVSVYECTQWSVDRADSTHPVDKCVQSGYVHKTQNLFYEAIIYRIDDNRHENPIYSRVAMPTCN